MSRFEIDVDPVDHITADAIGKPGQRVFYIQAWQDQRTVTVLIEKFQLQSLSVGVEQFLAEVIRQAPKTRCTSTRLWTRSSAWVKSVLVLTKTATESCSRPANC